MHRKLTIRERARGQFQLGTRFLKEWGVRFKMRQRSAIGGNIATVEAENQKFLRGAAVEDNRLISPSGTAVPGERTLDYFVAHELTHELTGRTSKEQPGA